jgi:hypothetical protein
LRPARPDHRRLGRRSVPVGGQRRQPLLQSCNRFVQPWFTKRFLREQPAYRCNLGTDLGERGIGLTTSLGLRPFTLAPRCSTLLFRLAVSLARSLFGNCRAIESVGRRGLCGLDRGQRLLELLLGHGQARSGIGHQLRAQAQALGDLERVARAGQADRQVVSRTQRVEVELHRRIAHFGGVVGVCLQLGVVRGRGNQCAGWRK